MENKIESLKIANLSKSFDGKRILDGINLTLYKNNIHTILGPSGSGKTTLLNIISGIKQYDSGFVYFREKSNISYLFQEDRLLKWMTVYKNIEIVLKDIMPKEEISIKIEHYLSMLGLSEFASHYPASLSGGMRQRVASIRAFLYPSNLLLMDEAFKSLDIKIKLKLTEAIINLWQTNPKTILFVTHDVREALSISNYIHIFSDTPTKIIKTYHIVEEAFLNRDLTKSYYLEMESDIYKHLLYY